MTYGHNFAAMVNCGKILGNTDFSASIFAMANIGKDELPPVLKTMLGDASSFINAFTGSAMLNYNGLSNMSFGLGPYITWSDFDEPPVVSLKLSATLGGGRF